MLSYQESFYDPLAYKGITVNVAQGTIADSWGFTDTFIHIEDFRGSKFRDTFNGDATDNTFMGLRGADVINGGDGWDGADYANDANYGGMKGIIANLAAGTIRDGWGSTDIVSGIEEVVGTRSNDQFIGGTTYAVFKGGGGVDSYAAGSGGMEVHFNFWNPVQSGASVDLALASGQVLNDGFGNVENLSGVTRIVGTELNDTFLGDGTHNELIGLNGNDIINGRGGNDFIDGSGGADTLTGGAGADDFHYDVRRGQDPWGDTIKDFTTGVDHITFYVPDFAGEGMDATLRFRNGASPGGTGSWFYFNAADHGLYWDADGTGSGAAVLVATLTGVTSLQSSDIELLT